MIELVSPGIDLDGVSEPSLPWMGMFLRVHDPFEGNRLQFKESNDRLSGQVGILHILAYYRYQERLFRRPLVVPGAVLGMGAHVCSLPNVKWCC